MGLNLAGLQAAGAECGPWPNAARMEGGSFTDSPALILII